MSKEESGPPVRFRNKASAAATVLMVIFLGAGVTMFGYLLLGQTLVWAVTAMLIFAIAAFSIGIIMNDWFTQQALAKEKGALADLKRKRDTGLILAAVCMAFVATVLSALNYLFGGPAVCACTWVIVTGASMGAGLGALVITMSGDAKKV